MVLFPTRVTYSVSQSLGNIPPNRGHQHIKHIVAYGNVNLQAVWLSFTIPVSHLFCQTDGCYVPPSHWGWKYKLPPSCRMLPGGSDDGPISKTLFKESLQNGKTQQAKQIPLGDRNGLTSLPPIGSRSISPATQVLKWPLTLPRYWHGADDTIKLLKCQTRQVYWFVPL